jgi:hypothetical protein
MASFFLDVLICDGRVQVEDAIKGSESEKVPCSQAERLEIHEL